MVATRLAAAQVGLGHTVGLWSYDEPHAAARIAAAMASLPHHASIRRHSTPRGGKLESLSGAAAAATLAGLAREYDYFHLHGVWESALVRAGRAAQGAGIPYCIAPHGMLDPYCLTQSALKKRIALLISHRRMLNAAAFLHTLNADERDLLKPLDLRCPMEVIPNGVFLEEIDPLPAPGGFRAKHPELGGDPYILFLSRLHHKKGLDYLADAFAAVLKTVPNARLVVAGPDGGEQAPFEARVRSLGIESRTHVIGPIYGRDKVSLLVDAAVFCLPSRQEGFSMAITEAMACGIPVVVSPECHFPEVAEAGAGHIAMLDAGRTAEALVRVLSDPPAARAMGVAGRKLVVDRFTWERVAERCAAAYVAHAGPKAGKP